MVYIFGYIYFQSLWTLSGIWWSICNHVTKCFCYYIRFLDKKVYLYSRSLNRFIYSKKYLIILFVSIILLGSLLVKYWNVVLSMNLVGVDAFEILNDDLYSIDFVFYTFFAPPLFYCSNAILAYCLFFKRVYNRMIIIYIYRIMLL